MLKNIRKGLIGSGFRNSVVVSQPCPSGHITADKRLRSNCLRFAAAKMSFMLGTLDEMDKNEV